MKTPQRTCLGCRARRAKSELVRLVAHEGRLEVDAAQRRPGRGGYVCPRSSCLERLMKTKEDRLRRAFRSQERLGLEGLDRLLQAEESGGE
jgi:predicted RNA-binding protein YlxR (DUF448 family)